MTDNILHYDTTPQQETLDYQSKRFTLSDGRQLEYFEFGDPLGIPTLYHHGMPGSAMEAAALHDVFIQHGLKLISPNRPGIGFSSKTENYCLELITSDTKELMDYLGHQKVSVIGWSSGGVPALWLAKSATEYVQQVILLSSYSHFSELEQAPFHQTGQASWLKRVVSRLPRLSLLCMAMAGYLANKLPKLYFQLMIRQCHVQDVDILQSYPHYGTMLLEAQRQSFRQSSASLFHDLVSQFEQWPFHLSSIDTPVTVFQGDCDPFVSERIGQHLADCLPNAEYNLLHGQGHLYWLEKSFHYRLARLCQT
ncbi:alpha/beta fold hydrolase [Litoribrevibacter euphylliae]|uniref:Alpha/beta fold hydrolase n=1 Tax=Litoribrevibacter euphylliae TaxID=1834034 RepID=A0ABV7HER8_9GAMM